MLHGCCYQAHWVVSSCACVADCSYAQTQMQGGAMQGFLVGWLIGAPCMATTALQPLPALKSCSQWLSLSYKVLRCDAVASTTPFASRWGPSYGHLFLQPCTGIRRQAKSVCSNSMQNRTSVIYKVPRFDAVACTTLHISCLKSPYQHLFLWPRTGLRRMAKSVCRNSMNKRTNSMKSGK